MSRPLPSEDDATIRLLARGPVQGAPAPGGGGWGRRLLVGGALGVVALGAAGLAVMMWPEGEPPPQRLGPRRLVPPLLRAGLRGDDTLFALARRTEQDESDPPGALARRERMELLAFAAADLAPRFAVHLATVPRGGMADAGLIAEQGATIWLWLGGLGAVSAVDGRVLADTEGLASRNAEIGAALGAGRGAVRTGEALVVEAPGRGGAWRIDPRDFTATLATVPPPRPLPLLVPAAAHGAGGATAFRVLEARLGEAWLGLPAEDVKLAAPAVPRLQGRFLSTAAPPEGTRQQMWRGAVRMASAAPPGWPANLPNRFGQAERLMDLATVPAVAGLSMAGFLTAGTPSPIVLAEPAGLMVLHGLPGEPLGLLRVAPDGQVAWRAALPILRLRSVLPGPRHLVLAGWTGMAGPAAEEVTLAVALADGAVVARPFSA